MKMLLEPRLPPPLPSLSHGRNKDHCVWMMGCIGFRNYRFFFLYIFYMWASKNSCLTELGVPPVNALNRHGQVGSCYSATMTLYALRHSAGPDASLSHVIDRDSLSFAFLILVRGAGTEPFWFCLREESSLICNHWTLDFHSLLQSRSLRPCFSASLACWHGMCGWSSLRRAPSRP